MLRSALVPGFTQMMCIVGVCLAVRRYCFLFSARLIFDTSHNFLRFKIGSGVCSGRVQRSRFSRAPIAKATPDEAQKQCGKYCATAVRSGWFFPNVYMTSVMPQILP